MPYRHRSFPAPLLLPRLRRRLATRRLPLLRVVFVWEGLGCVQSETRREVQRPSEIVIIAVVIVDLRCFFLVGG